MSSCRFARVQAGRRLVEAEQLRVGAHGAGDLQPALRAVGEVGGRIVGAVDEADLLQPAARLLDRLRLGLLVAGKAEHAEDRHAGGDHQRVVLRDHQVLEHRQAAEEPDVLERARDLRLGGDAVVGHALEQELGAARLAQRDPALARLVEAGDAVEDGGLAGAVRADQPGDVAALGLERHVVDGEQAAEAHGQMLDRQDRIGRADVFAGVHL